MQKNNVLKYDYKKIEHNIPRLYAFKSLQWFLIIIPIIIPFYQSVGLTMTEILTLQSVFSLSVALLEIPSGYFADVLGRKNSLLIGACCSTAGYVVYCFSHSFIFFLIAELIMGIGSSFISGADSALFYDSLLTLNRQHEFKKLEGRRSALGNFSESAASILGGLLAVVSLRLPVYIETAVLACSIPLAFFLVEPPIHESQKKRASFMDILLTVRFTLHENKNLKWLMLYASLLGASTLTIVWFIQPYFKLVGLPLASYGVVWAVLNISVGLFSISAHRVEKRMGQRNTLLMLLPLSAGSYFILSFFPSLWILPVLFIFYFVRGTNGPVLSDYMNQHIPRERRATILSINALLVRIFFAVLGPIAGFLTDRYSLTTALRFLGGVFLVFGLFVLSRVLKKKSERI